MPRSEVSLKSKEEIQERLISMIHTMFDIPLEEIKYESRFYDDLGLDSLDAIDLIATFQGEIGRRIGPEEFSEVRKVGDVVEIIGRILLQKNNETSLQAE